jgi:hypothetical protein
VEMNDEKLIEFVKKNTVIYDLSNPKYMDNSLKEKIWKEIGEDMKVDGK